MKNMIVLVCMLTCFRLAAQSPAEEVHCKMLDNEKRTAEWMARGRSMENNLSTANYDLIYYRLNIAVDPAVNFIKGAVTTYFKPTDADFSEITFDASQYLTIDSALYHGQSIAYTSGPGSDQKTFQLPAPINAGVLDSVTIYYGGSPVSSGFGSFSLSSHNGQPLLYTFSIPYGAKDWWVCKQTTDDKADSLDVIVRTPSQYVVASNGLLAGTSTIGNDKVFYWKHRYPIVTYLVAIAVTNYATFNDTLNNSNGPLEVQNFAFPENLNAAQSGITALLPVLDLFEQIYGPYPFRNEKVGNAQFDWGGGMEHQSIAFVTDFSRGLLAHEQAHQWFGDAITCASYTHVWLSEGFATYSAALADQMLGPVSAFNDWKATAIGTITSSAGGSVYCTDTTNIDRIYDYRLTYLKGAMLLHMLRWKMGDAAFFSGIQHYFADPERKHHFALTDDLKAHLEATSGLNLDGFFSDWFYGEGYPKYEIRWTQTDSDNKVYLKLNQTSSHPSVDFYEMPVQIQLSGIGFDTTILVDHTFNGQLVDVTTSFKVYFVYFDPQKQIVSKSSIIKDNTLSVLDLAEGGIRVFPNPVHDLLNVQCEGAPMDAFRVYDAQGKLVYLKTESVSHFEWDTSGLPSGVYFIRIQKEGRDYQGKIARNP